MPIPVPGAASDANAVRDNILPWPIVPALTAAGDQVQVIHRGRTLIYRNPFAMHDAVLDACAPIVALKIAAAVTKAVRAERDRADAERRAGLAAHRRRQAGDLYRLALAAVLAGVVMALLYGVVALVAGRPL